MCYKEIYNIEAATLICLVQAHPVLWDSFDDLYKYKLYACEAWYDICTRLNGKYETLSDDDKEIYWCSVVNKWRYIRESFRHWLRVEKPGNTMMKEELMFNKYISQFLEDMCDRDGQFSGAEDYDSSSSPSDLSDSSDSENGGKDAHQKSLYTTCLDNSFAYSESKTQQKTSSRSFQGHEYKKQSNHQAVIKDSSKARALQRRDIAKAKACLKRESAALDKKIAKSKSPYEQASLLGTKSSLEQDHLELQKIIALQEMQVQISLDKQKVEAFKEWQDRANQVSLEKQKIKAFKEWQDRASLDKKKKNAVNELEVHKEKQRLQAFKEWRDRSILQKKKKKNVSKLENQVPVEKTKNSKGWHEVFLNWWNQKSRISTQKSTDENVFESDLEESLSLYTTCIADNTLNSGSEMQQKCSVVKDKKKKYSEHSQSNFANKDMTNTSNNFKLDTSKIDAEYAKMSKSRFAETLRYFESKRQDYHNSNVLKSKLKAAKEHQESTAVKKKINKVKRRAPLPLNHSTISNGASERGNNSTLYNSCISDSVDAKTQDKFPTVNTNAAKKHAKDTSSDNQIEEKVKKLSFSDNISECGDNDNSQNQYNKENFTHYESCLADTTNYCDFNESQKTKDTLESHLHNLSQRVSSSTNTTNYFEPNASFQKENPDFNFQNHSLYDSCVVDNSNYFKSQSPEAKKESNLDDNTYVSSSSDTATYLESKSPCKKESNVCEHSFYTSCLTNDSNHFESKSKQKKEDNTLYNSCSADTTSYFDSKSPQDEKEKCFQNSTHYSSCSSETVNNSDNKSNVPNSSLYTSSMSDTSYFEYKSQIPEDTLYNSCSANSSHYFDSKIPQNKNNPEDRSLYTSCLKDTTAYFESKSPQEEDLSSYASCFVNASMYSDSKTPKLETSRSLYKEIPNNKTVPRDSDSSSTYDSENSDPDDYEKMYASCLTDSILSKKSVCDSSIILEKEVKRVVDLNEHDILDTKSVKTEGSTTWGSKDTVIRRQKSQNDGSIVDNTKYLECNESLKHNSVSFSNNTSKSKDSQEISSGSNNQSLFSTQPKYSTPFRMSGPSGVTDPNFQVSYLDTPVINSKDSTDIQLDSVTQLSKSTGMNDSLVPPLTAKQRHVSFFKAVLPTLKTLSDDETLLYQQKVLQVIRAIKSRRSS